MIKKQNFGKKLKVGDTFSTTTKKLYKAYNIGPFGTWPRAFGKWEILRTNDERYFTKGKRKYYCRVIRLMETRTGFNITYLLNSDLRATQ